MSKSIIILLVAIAAVSASVDLSGYTLVKLEGLTASVSVAKGEKFALKVAGNPTTGYNWFLANKNELQSSNVVAFLSESESGEYEGTAHQRNIVGVGGNSFFKFQGVNAGSAVIGLDYKRSWENEVIKHIDVTVQVNN